MKHRSLVREKQISSLPPDFFGESTLPFSINELDFDVSLRLLPLRFTVSRCDEFKFGESSVRNCLTLSAMGIKADGICRFIELEIAGKSSSETCLLACLHCSIHSGETALISMATAALNRFDFPLFQIKCVQSSPNDSSMVAPSDCRSLENASDELLKNKNKIKYNKLINTVIMCATIN